MNSAASPVPAAQYLRMSTEHQNFSLENQTAILRQYAEKHSFSVVKTYVDAGRTGVVLKNRKGLAQLLRDVVQGDQPYRAILVYDVSRWGRFQDTDEAAYYEFLCKRAGVLVHYCAETFSNDATMPSAIMKALKRAMAGEYSRELGVKTHAGHQRSARLGFKQGGQPGYGLRRLLVSADGRPKHLLDAGQRKSIASDRVVQVLGPANEVRCVKEIYEMFVRKNMTFKEIAKELNRRRIKYVGGSEWNHTGRSVSIILTHPKYAGFNVYGRSTKRLYAPSVDVPRSEWTIVPSAFEALVEPLTFAEAQRMVETSGRNISDDGMLDALKAGLVKHGGKLTVELMASTLGIPSASLYRRRFGSLSRAYELIGYDGFWRGGGWLEKRRYTHVLREDLMKRIVELSRDQISIENRGPSFRTRLRLHNGKLISVLASRTFRTHEGSVRWRLQPVSDESLLVTLIARLTIDNRAFKDFYVIPPFCTSSHIILKENDPRLNRGIRLDNLGDLCAAFHSVSASGVPSFPKYLRKDKCQ
ncbi:MAG: recombinase family protein [Candidatus Sulfotelmatobacter sp.]